MLDVAAPSASLFKPLEVPTKLLMGPGPSNCPPNVLRAASLPMLGHLHPEFTKIMDEVKSGLQYLFQTRSPYVLAISGTGHAGMEASFCNLIEPGDVVLVTSSGIWGERAADIARRQGGDVYTITKPPGEAFCLNAIQRGLERYKPKILFVCHVESSTGLVQPLDGIGALCHKYGCLLLLDTVASLGGDPVFMDRMQIDVIYAGSQKVIGAPAGTAPIAFSKLARDKILARKTPVRSFYFDMNWLWNYWGCDDQPRKYHHTGPISSIYALREGLSNIAREGLETCWERHRLCAQQLYAAIEGMGLKLFLQKPETRAVTVTTIRVPDGLNSDLVRAYAMEKYNVDIAGGLGATVGKVWRIGIMGHNAYQDKVDLVVKAFKEGYEHAAALSHL